MKDLLNPKTIAVIGASNNRKKVGYSLMANLKKFKGNLFPINLKGKPILGKKSYKSVLDVPKHVDMALVAVPAPAVLQVVKECVKKNIRDIVILSAGFSEIGNREGEKQILEVTKGKARVLGPNCISGDSSILITNDNKTKYKQIGSLIDGLLDKYKEHVINISGTYVLDLKYHNKELNIASYHKGRIVKKKIVKVMKRTGGKVLKITCDGGHELICSEDHPVIIKKNGKLIKVNASDLKGDELIPIVRDMNFNRTSNLACINLVNEFKNLPPNIRKKVWVKFKNKKYLFDKFIKFKDYDLKEAGLYVKNEQITLPALLEVSEELCKLLGFFIADGNYKSNCLRIGYVGCRDAEKEIRRCINNVFNSNLVSLSNCKDIKFGRSIGRILFKEVFKIGGGALNKTIPDFIFNTSEKNIIAFLNGLYSGDGCIYLYKNKIKATLTITSISKTLIEQLGYLFALLDIGPFYKRVRYIGDDYQIRGKACKANKQYILRTDSSQIIKNLYKKGFRFLVKNKNNILGTIVGRGYNFPSREIKQIYYRKIRDIENIEEGMGLYDFEVEGSHNFVANQILTSNCFGIVVPSMNIDTTFALTTPGDGHIAFISQSGALWAGVSIYSKLNNFGFSYFISVGNMMDLDFSDFLEFLDKDKNTEIIILYIERLADGRRFMDAVKKCKKPIIAIKAGRSEAGKRAALSHTGSLAGSYDIYEAAFKQSGVILVETLEEAFAKAKFLQAPKGNKIVIITNAGGPGTLTADYCEKHGFDVAKLPENLKFEKLPRAWSHNNPIDIVGDADADRFKYVFDNLVKNKSFFDAAIIVMTQQKMINVKGTVKEIINFKKKLGKPLAVCWMTNADKSALEKASIPCFFEPELVAKSFVLKK